jgi:hypothetical protein
VFRKIDQRTVAAQLEYEGRKKEEKHGEVQHAITFSARVFDSVHIRSRMIFFEKCGTKVHGQRVRKPPALTFFPS